MGDGYREFAKHVVKFAEPGLQAKLLETGNEELVEGNYWGDTFWGVCRGRGENHLGKLLMKVRTYYKNQKAVSSLV